MTLPSLQARVPSQPSLISTPAHLPELLTSSVYQTPLTSTTDKALQIIGVYIRAFGFQPTAEHPCVHFVSTSVAANAYVTAVSKSNGLPIIRHTRSFRIVAIAPRTRHQNKI
jgi:hypothetical protein